MWSFYECSHVFYPCDYLQLFDFSCKGKGKQINMLEKAQNAFDYRLLVGQKQF